MPPLRIGLIGFGYWGPNLARNFHALPGCTLAAICDANPERLAKARDLYQSAALVQDVDALLANDSDAGVIDAIAIATPARSHYPLTKAALHAGKHVLVEKPLAMTVTEARELVDLAAAVGRTLMVGHVFEYNPAVRHIKTLLDEGAIGRPYYLYSTRVNLGRVQSDINALWSIAPHDISIALFLFGQMPVSVSARGARYLNGEVEDVIFLTLDFPDGLLAHVHASWLDPSKMRRMTLVGSEKMIIYDDLAVEGKVKVYDKGVIRLTDPQYGEYQYRLHAGDIAIPKLPLLEPLRLECEDFVAAIQRGAAPLADGHSGLRVVQVLEAAQQSLRSGGQPVAIA
ncbi:MAG: Gfo/Idh/MocA family oxidoreductase [Caldilineales bacterium]|nr:Gfo/Idh/MocA family oxidoreductase [Caldilineales bacterium]